MKTKDMSSKDMARDLGKSILWEPLISEHCKNLFLKMRTFRGSLRENPRITELFEVPLYNFGKLIGRSLKIIKEGYEEGKNEKVKGGGKNNKN